MRFSLIEYISLAHFEVETNSWDLNKNNKIWRNYSSSIWIIFANFSLYDYFISSIKIFKIEETKLICFNQEDYQTKSKMIFPK